MDIDLGNRLKSLRGNLPQKEFARALKIHTNTVGRWERNEQSPTHKELFNIIENFPDINPTWLLTGEGRMTKSTEQKQDLQPSELEKPQFVSVDENGQTSIPQWQSPDPKMFDYIPMAEAKLSAGGGAFVLSEQIEGYYAFRKSWLNTITSSAKDLVLMRVSGDSMYPTIQSRDTVMIDTGRKHIKDGEIYALRVDDTVMIKRLSFRVGGKILIISDNRKEFDAYEADIADIHILGQVIFLSRVLIHE